jgi:hypothetical protein
LQHYLVRHATVIVRHLHDCCHLLSVAVMTRELSGGWFIPKLETATLSVSLVRRVLERAR